MKLKNLPVETLVIRALQLGLIAITVVSMNRSVTNLSQGLDFALNRPATTDEQRASILAELPRYFTATDPNTVVVEALERGDLALAKLYINYASGLRRDALTPETLARYEEETSWTNTLFRRANDCTLGAIFRESDNMTAIGCQMATDLFVVGDIADILKEGPDWYYGREYDEVILGLSLVGAGASALTAIYPAAAPAAGGVSAAKVIARPTTKGFKLSGLTLIL